MDNFQTKPPIIAAIDIGTNSFHLIVAEIDSRGMLKILTREKEVVRLGSSGNDMKYLSSDAIERGVQTLKRFIGLAKSMTAQISAVATSAVREAVNRDEFINRVFEETGVEIQVVSGIEEGRLIYLGALHSLPIVERKTLIIDIGGGSTETIIGNKGEPLYVHSEKIGAIRLTKRFNLEDEITPNKLRITREYIKGVWEPIFNRLNEIGYDSLVGTAGTILNIGAMTLAQTNGSAPDILNGALIEKKKILKTIRKILTAKNLKERKELLGMDLLRADIIVGGALILEYALEHANVDTILLSTFGLREGVVFDSLEKRMEIERFKHLSHLRESTIHSLATRYSVDLTHSLKVKDFALKLFDVLKNYHHLGIREREWLESASILHDVGYLISVDQHHKHSYYIISQCVMPGFTIDEAEIIANIARYHRKSHPKKSHENFINLSDQKQNIVRILAGILRIAEGIDRRHQQIVADIIVENKGNNLKIHLIPSDHNIVPDIEAWGAERRKSLLQEALGIKIEIIY
ncbi:MAG: Ppx/GppA phosphatase family protein [Candidatus Kapaibacteriales bacterium]